MPLDFSTGDPFTALVRSWMRIIQVAVDYKKKEFSNDAEEALKFFDGPHDFMYSSDYASKSASFATEANFPVPTFKMTLNKVAEMVQLFGPHLYHRNPFRQITPRTPVGIPAQLLANQVEGPEIEQLQAAIDLQNEQQRQIDGVRANLLMAYLNYLPNEMDLKTHARQAIDETIIKGLGCLWHEIYIPEGSQQRFIRSVFDSVDNLVVDSDMESIRDAKWVARRRVLPVWEIENRFGIPSGEIRGNTQSLAERANFESASYGDDHLMRAQGESNDLMVFWEVYSRMGAGHLMKSPKATYWNDKRSPHTQFFERFGPYVYLAVCDEYPCPLNLPKPIYERGDMDEMFFRLQWPTPFWADPAHPWPFSHLEFHPRPRKVYPMSHLKPGLGELKLLNWLFSFLADHIKNTCRDFVALPKGVEEDIKTAILSGKDLTLIEIESQHGKTISDVVSFLQHPQMNKDVWQIIDYVMKLFEQRTGLTELMYGQSSRQLRSAKEAQVKSEQVQVRPDDMANKVEDWMTLAARKEALAARWHIRPEDVRPIIGAAQSTLWGRLVSSSEVLSVTHELEYRIEAGSIRKPNRERDIQNATTAVQMWAPVLQNYAQGTGDFKPLNALIEYWCRANDMEAAAFLMQPPPPPQGPSPEEQAAQVEMMLGQAKFQLEQAKAGQEMEHDQQRFALDLQKLILELEAKRQELQLKAQESQLEMRQTQFDHEADRRMKLFELDAEREEQQLKLAGMRETNAVKLETTKQQSAAKVQAAKAQAKAKPKPTTNGSGKR